MAEVDLSALPPEFRGLVPLIRVWGDPDDGDRDSRLEAASSQELQRIVDAVEPCSVAIFEYVGDHLDADKAGWLGALADVAVEAAFVLDARAVGRVPGLSERNAQGLLERARAYGELHAGVFGGAWLAGSDGGFRAVVASFVGALLTHRAALDPRIDVIAAERTAARREEFIAQIRRFAETYPGVRIESFDYSDFDGGSLTIEIEAADEAAFDRDLRARFGTLPDVYYLRYLRWARPLEQWQTDETDRQLTVWWTADHGADVQLAAVEDHDQVRLTLTAATLVGHHRSPTSVGPEMHFGNVGPTEWEQSATLTL